jgi:DNA primase
LRGHLEALGHPRQAVVESGLSDECGRDRLWRAITFPIEETASFYGRHIDSGGLRHQFPPRSKGGLYGWNRASECGELIVVEGLFDLASLWQAGFTNSVALLGSHFSAGQLAQLRDGHKRTVYLCLDADANGSGQQAALAWMRRLAQAGLPVRRIELPCGIDPNRLLNRRGGQQEFQRLWEQAR